MHRSVVYWGVSLGCALWMGLASTARAGGYDAFMWHTARHMGLAGAAVSYVSGPEAAFHNPAGLAQSARAEVLVAPGLLRGRLHAAPSRDVNVDTTPMVAPYGMLGGSLRLNDWLVAGVGLFPIAAAGGNYRYDGVLGETRDETRALILELAPSLGFQLPLGFRVGLSYRITGMYMRRYSRGAEANMPGIHMNLFGLDFGGFRLGVQWSKHWRSSPIDARALHAGLVYRHTVTLDLEGDEGYAAGMRLNRAQMEFILPARITAGVRGDLQRWSLTADLELRLDSQNDRTAVNLELASGQNASLPNIFEWRNSVGVRTGLEFRALDDGRLPLRLGYAFDGATVPKSYPNAFAPPPADMHMITCGAGYRMQPFEVNVAYSFRTGSTRVRRQDVEDSDFCAFCGHPGKYSVVMHGVYVDVSYRID